MTILASSSSGDTPGRGADAVSLSGEAGTVPDDGRPAPYAALGQTKIVMAPVNISGQPITLVNELRRNGVNASLVQYVGNAEGHKFGYEKDRLVKYSGTDRSKMQIRTIEDLLTEGTDIFHFWLRTLFFGGVYTNLTGFDLPLLKAYGRKLVYRFTGEDLRVRSLHESLNPYNAYKYGYATVINEARQRKYLDFIAEFVDQFVVQDPELLEYWPTARLIPRALDLSQWPYCGPVAKDRPLVVHAPSNPAVKGTPFVHAAVQKLKDEGLQFDYREVVDMPHGEAAALYRSADIVVDQLHIGWYGVLAIEALALGKAVITYVREPLGERLGVPIPILNANPDTVESTLRQTIKDYDLRSELAPRARRFVETVHDVRVVARELAVLYGDVLSGVRGPPRVAERPYAGLDYLLEQHDLLDSTVVKPRGKTPERPHPRLGWLRRRLHAAGRAMALWRGKRGDQRGELAEARREIRRLRVTADKYEKLKQEVFRLRYLVKKSNEAAAQQSKAFDGKQSDGQTPG